MTITKIKIPPGLKTENTVYADSPAYVDGDKIRFWKGEPQPIGGWVQTLTPQFLGIARGKIQIWRSLDALDWMGFGTHLKLYVETGSTLTDITPVESSGTLGTDPFTTDAAASGVVTVSHTAHGVVEGQFVIFAGATGFDGITSVQLNGEHQVTEVVDSNSYKIDTGGSATAGSISGGGASVEYQYLLSPGQILSIPGLGYGAGPYGLGTYGTPRESGVTSLTLGARTWSLATWGEDLIANPRGGYIYIWDESAGTSANRAVRIAAAPGALSVGISDQARHMIAFGCETVTDDGIIDPLLIRWCDSEDYTQWTAAATNTAGDLRLNSGTQIMQAVPSRGQHLILTDADAFAFQYIGSDFVFNLQRVGSNCGAVSPHSAVDRDGIVYWMGPRNFFVYDGTVRVLDCDIESDVYDEFTALRKDETFAALNREWNEIWWFYTTADDASDDINRYVIYNYVEDTWSKGSMARTAWTDAYIRANPIAMGTDGYVYNHELGMNADTSPLNSYVVTSPFELGEGEQFTFLDKVIPNFDVTKNFKMNIIAKRYPSATEEITKGPYTILPTTQKVDTRIRGRQFRFRFYTDQTDAFFRMGLMRVNVRPDGRR